MFVVIFFHKKIPSKFPRPETPDSLLVLIQGPVEQAQRPERKLGHPRRRQGVLINRGPNASRATGLRRPTEACPKPS